MKIDIMTGQVAGCNMCVHKRGNVCLAYPQGIPLPFSSGEFLHDKKTEGDNGFIFTPPDDAIIVEFDTE